jgi:hypothetical protein
MSIVFEEVLLEKQQRELLGDLVEADRLVDAGMPRQFLVLGMLQGYVLTHPKMEKETIDPGDVRALEEYRLIRRIASSGRDPAYEVTNAGRQYYAWMKQSAAQPVERVEAEARRLVQADRFRERHPAAHDRWAQAERKLWEAETNDHFTDIGHACREAIQLFVTDLVTEHRVEDANPDPQKTVARLKAVMAKAGTPTTVTAFSEALLAYFGAVSDLIQRQEHGAQKEGEPLAWEDARRVVFQTLLIMFELDRTP